MLSEMFTYLVLFKILLYYSYAISITKWSQKRVLENLRLTTNINLLTTHSAITCAVECANIPPCMSFSYHVGNNTCLLYLIPFTGETTGAVSEDGWKSYNLMCGNGQIGLEYFYKRNLNMCYHVESDEVKNVTEAILFCSAGGRLLKINTVEKQAHMVEFLTSLPIESVYIGGMSEHRDDLFLYEDGTQLTVFFWFSGNPKGQYAIRMKKKFNFTWRNNHGEKPTPFLCEMAV